MVVIIVVVVVTIDTITVSLAVHCHRRFSRLSCDRRTTEGPYPLVQLLYFALSYEIRNAYLKRILTVTCGKPLDLLSRPNHLHRPSTESMHNHTHKSNTIYTAHSSNRESLGVAYTKILNINIH